MPMLNKVLMKEFTVPSTDIGYSAPLDLFQFTGLGATVSWTGTPTAVITLQIGNDGKCEKDVEKTGAPASADVGEWDDDPNVVAPNDPAGTDLRTTFNLSDIQSRFVRFKIDGTTNNGVYSIKCNAKGE